MNGRAVTWWCDTCRESTQQWSRIVEWLGWQQVPQQNSGNRVIPRRTGIHVIDVHADVFTKEPSACKGL